MTAGATLPATAAPSLAPEPASAPVELDPWAWSEGRARMSVRRTWRGFAVLLGAMDVRTVQIKRRRNPRAAAVDAIDRMRDALAARLDDLNTLRAIVAAECPESAELPERPASPVRGRQRVSEEFAAEYEDGPAVQPEPAPEPEPEPAPPPPPEPEPEPEPEPQAKRKPTRSPKASPPVERLTMEQCLALLQLHGCKNPEKELARHLEVKREALHQIKTPGFLRLATRFARNWIYEHRASIV